MHYARCTTRTIPGLATQNFEDFLPWPRRSTPPPSVCWKSSAPRDISRWGVFQEIHVYYLGFNALPNHENELENHVFFREESTFPRKVGACISNMLFLVALEHTCILHTLFYAQAGAGLPLPSYGEDCTTPPRLGKPQPLENLQSSSG